ncbi:hypothetical protein KEM52_005608 [Ascosphaera acerosa]|nr:hypothetical protein KEM52_005608 [Ascosphaera acerosa]
MVSHYRVRNRSNFFKKLVGLNLYLSGVSRQCLDVIAQWGCCDSYITLHRDTQLIAQHAARRRMALARNPQTLIAYGNFQFNAHFRDHAMGAICNQMVKTITGVLVKNPHQPTSGLTISMYDKRRLLSINRFRASPALHKKSVARQNSRYHMAQTIRSVFEVAFDQVFVRAPAATPTVADQRVLRRAKTLAGSLAAIFHGESTIQGVYGVHPSIFLNQFKYSDAADSTDFDERLWLVYSDQKTVEFNHTIKLRQQCFDFALHRRRWLLPIACLFHTAQALAYTIICTHYATPQDERLRQTLGLTAPQTDAMTLRHGGLHKVIASLSPTQFKKAIDHVYNTLFTESGWQEGSDLSAEHTSACQLDQLVETFLTLNHAVRIGNVGTIERLTLALSVLFYGAEQYNDVLKVLHLHHLLAVSQPPLKEAILAGLLVSQSSSPSRFKPIDLHLKHLNGALAIYIKHHDNSTHNIQATYQRITGAVDYTTHLRQVLDGYYSNHMNTKHSYRQACEDSHTYTADLQRKVQFRRHAPTATAMTTTESGDGAAFVSPNILAIGGRLMWRKITDFNKAIVDGQEIMEHNAMPIPQGAAHELMEATIE